MTAEEGPSNPPPPPTSENYVDVGKALPEWSTWSNDPADMKLETYFNTDPNIPGLAQQFGLPGLRPVIVLTSTSLGDKFLLTDQTGAYFLWNELQPELWRFNFEGLTKKSLPDMVTLVTTENYGNTDLLRQYNPDIARRERRSG